MFTDDGIFMLLDAQVEMTARVAYIIDHFTVVHLVTWSLNGSEAGVDLVLIQTSLLLLRRSRSSYAN